MTSDSLLPDDEPPSMPSMPTQRGDGGSALGRVDHYELLRKLGGGGFGVVYLARDTVGGIEVALKTLHPLLKHNAEEMELLRERFALVSRLSHPNIATALVLHPCREVDVWDEGARRELKLSPGDRVMVMRYAPGATLSKWRRQFPGGIVPFNLAIEVGRQVAAALDYAHSERIVHRDIKPGNIMVETVAAEPRPLDHGQGAARSSSAPTLRARILDFGLAAEIRSSLSRVSMEAGDTSGTRPYMAPEQWLGRNKQDGRTDQYALACVLYELLSGAPPFAGVFETGDPIIMRTAVVTDPPEEIEGVPPATNEALMRALSKAPKDRFPTCAEFVGNCLAQRPPSSPEVVPAQSPGAQQASGKQESTDRPGVLRSSEVHEADVLRSKVAVFRALSAVPAEDRADAEFSRPLSDADMEFAVAEEALRITRFAAAAECLDRAEAALDLYRQAKRRREEAIALKSARHALLDILLRIQAKREVEEREEAERNRPGAVLSVTVADVTFNLRRIPAKGTQPAFWMGETPVTQALWTAVMGSNPSYFKRNDQRPVENVSWNDCQDFLKKVNSLDEVRRTDLSFRLSTEAEWEHACRAGCDGQYCRLADGTEIVRETLDRVAWFDDNSNETTHPVRQKEPNAWGLYDMHGNVWEWTETADGDYRVFRGGCFFHSIGLCAAGYRSWDYPDLKSRYLGLRLCATCHERHSAST